MARPREFDSDKVSAALRDVFWEYGYEGTSYANIMAATGLQKGSLYAAFGGKRNLYLEALRRYDDDNVSACLTLLSDENMTGEDRISALMEMLVEAAQTKKGRWGCLLCNAAIDQSPFDKPTEKAVGQSMDRMKQGIEAALKETRAADKIELIWTLYFGGRVIIKSGANKATLRTLKAQVLDIL